MPLTFYRDDVYSLIRKEEYTVGKKPKNTFISTLRRSFKHHHTLNEVWDWLLGNKIPSPNQRQVLIAHFKSYGLEVSPRDFIRGTAASNNPIFIQLRLLRRGEAESNIITSSKSQSAH